MTTTTTTTAPLAAKITVAMPEILAKPHYIRNGFHSKVLSQSENHQTGVWLHWNTSKNQIESVQRITKELSEGIRYIRSERSSVKKKERDYDKKWLTCGCITCFLFCFIHHFLVWIAVPYVCALNTWMPVTFYILMRVSCCTWEEKCIIQKALIIT